MSRPFDKLVARLREEYPEAELPENLTLHRTYAGRIQKQVEAWSWFAVDENGSEVVGSCYPVGELVKRDKLKLYRDPWNGREVWTVDPDGPM